MQANIQLILQHHLPVRPLHHMQRTRGMHVVEGHDDELDRQLVEEEEAIEEWVYLFIINYIIEPAG